MKGMLIYVTEVIEFQPVALFFVGMSALVG